IGGGLMPQRAEGGARFADRHAEPLALEDHPQRPADVRLVVDHDHVALARHARRSSGAAGRGTRNAAPPSSLATTATSPPHRSAFFLTIDSPSPIPSFLNVIVGSNREAAASALRPGPES